MSVVRFIADQRTMYAVPHAFSCRLLEVSESWFYKWLKAPTSARAARRAVLDAAVLEAFKGSKGSYGSPRVWEDLVDPEIAHPELAVSATEPSADVVVLPVQQPCSEGPEDALGGDEPTGAAVAAGDAGRAGAEPGNDVGPLLDSFSGPERLAAGLVWNVSVNTVADSMRRQGLMGREVKRNRGLTRQDRTKAKFPDLLKRDFTAAAPNLRWVGDITEIPTDEGKLFMATVLDLCSRRLLAAPTSDHPNAELAMDAINMAVAVRGGAEQIRDVIFHTDRGSTYTATDFTDRKSVV